MCTARIQISLLIRVLIFHLNKLEPLAHRKLSSDCVDAHADPSLGGCGRTCQPVCFAGHGLINVVYCQNEFCLIEKRHKGIRRCFDLKRYVITFLFVYNRFLQKYAIST